MDLPAFEPNGDLPPGVYRVTLAEVLERFGAGTARRRVVAERLVRIYGLAISTENLARFVVFGSFVTSKPEPRDVDIVLVMADGFDSSALSGEAAAVFHHDEADAQLGASVFWVTRSGAFGGEQSLVEYWQATREGGRRGILDIVPEGT